MMRCLFIGLDAFDPDLLREGVRRGDFPALARLMSRGRICETTTDPGTYVGSLWATVHTGVDPSRHGLYCWADLEPGTYRVRLSDERNIKNDSFWTALSRAGYRCAIVDIPHCKLDPDINGLHVINWLTHFKSVEGFASAPAGLADELARRFGLDPVPHCNAVDHSPEGLGRFTEAMLARVEWRTVFTRELVMSGDFDLVAIGYGESHCVGHQCYHRHLASPFSADDPILRVYRAIDRAVGQLLEACSEDCAIVLLASHGIGPHFDGSHIANRLLRKVDRAVAAGRPVPRARRLLDFVAANRLRSLLGPAARLLPPELPRSAHYRAFVVPNNEVALGVRVNLEGREPAGLVSLDQYDVYLDALQDVLMQARRPDDGSPAFVEALRTVRLYGIDPMRNRLPDLMLTWDRSRPFSGLEIPSVTRIMAEAQSVRTGDHRAGGLAVLAGSAGHNADRGAAMDSAEVAHHILGVFGIGLEFTAVGDVTPPAGHP
ncbi:MAG: alkaline phosphatase family protein [Xanthobacteraceae bacterium]|nr:alkaline phosphatase family protein [Xanthobacteraceae bacterium]